MMTLVLSEAEKSSLLGLLRDGLVNQWGEVKVQTDWGDAQLALLPQRFAERIQAIYTKIHRGDLEHQCTKDELSAILIGLRAGLTHLWGEAQFIRNLARDPMAAPILERHAEAGKILYQRIEAMQDAG